MYFRENLLRKVQRNCVVNTSTQPSASGGAESGLEEGDEMERGVFAGAEEEQQCSAIFKSLVQTILSQAHLLPLPLEARPIYWELDHALRLEPLPHLLVLADHVEQYRYDAEGTSTVNPGSFASDGSFLVYYPSSRTAEFSRV